jgi:hypothetical protein
LQALLPQLLIASLLWIPSFSESDAIKAPLDKTQELLKSTLLIAAQSKFVGRLRPRVRSGYESPLPRAFCCLYVCVTEPTLILFSAAY